MNQEKGRYIAAVVGGACSGAEVTKQLTDAGIEVVVFEQNPLPYGKIEDGLPRWHTKLRNREFERIDKKLNQPLVHYVPLCRLGEDLHLQDLIDLGFSLVVLANGAWRDRPLRAEGIEEVEDHSFVYQNPFIYWFNHHHEENFTGPHYPVQEGAVVIGGGLASIDVLKVCQLEMTMKKLRQRGLEVDMEQLERKGFPRYLERFDLLWEDLEIEPARLVYRRRVIDMPLASPPDDPTDEQIAKIQEVRQKIINHAQDQYRFEVLPQRIPVKIHTEGGSVCGVTLAKTRLEGRKVITTDEKEYMETNLVISSIGSIPEPLPGIDMKGELYDIIDKTTGQFKNYPSVFGVGNAITGKGNIQASLKHGRYVGQILAGALGKDPTGYASLIEDQKEEVQEQIKAIFEYLSQISPLEESRRQVIRAQVKAWQEERNYPGDYEVWKEKMKTEKLT